MTAACGDTNLLASGIVGFRRRESTPGELLRRWRGGEYELVTSEPILAELLRTLALPYFALRINPLDVAELLPLLTQAAVPITVTVTGVATHPEDDLVLATAVSAHAGYLVTGDQPFRRRVRSYQDVRLLSPREFLTVLEGQH